MRLGKNGGGSLFFGFTREGRAGELEIIWTSIWLGVARIARALRGSAGCRLYV
jgi:hypothetical protein